VSGIQWAVLAFFGSVWVALAIVLVAAPEIYSLAIGSVAPDVFFAAISFLIAVCVLGVVRRWRWIFWLVLAAFLSGAFRVVASALQLSGALPEQSGLVRRIPGSGRPGPARDRDRDARELSARGDLGQLS
jgi:hypothetical protein